MNESDVLAVNPFEGDFGTPGDKTLHDKIVTARKKGECNICGGQVIPGTRIRAMTEKFEGRLEYHRFCHACCVAMAKSWEDGGEALEIRTNLRIEKEAE